MSKKLICIVICYIVMAGLVAISAGTSGTTFGAIIALVCAVFGWRTLNSITPAMFIWMPLVGWIAYFIIKFVISYFIGLIVAPYCIGTMIAEGMDG